MTIDKVANTLAALAAALALAGCGAGNSSAVPALHGEGACAGEGAGDGWISAWGGTRTSGTAPANATIRNLARVTAGGAAIRLRFFNMDASTPLTISKATVALRDGTSGASLQPDTLRPVTFCGEPGAVIPPGTASFYSDPIALPVAAQDDVAVSIFGPAGNPGEFSTEWNYSHVSAEDSGDLTGEVSGAAFTATSNALFALRDVEVQTTDATGAIVFLGSSSFHGSNSTRDAHRRVGDQISRRINAEVAPGQQKTVVNRAIGGDTLEAAFRTRIDDVWSTVGVDAVVVWVTNDLTTRSADEVIADYVEIKALAHERGINLICPTWVPGAQSGPANFNGERQKLNEWIRTPGNCDAMVDYAAVVENEAVPYTWKPEYLSDHIHTNDAGHTAWADATPIEEWVALPAPAP